MPWTMARASAGEDGMIEPVFLASRKNWRRKVSMGVRC
jgi:hypothetical protein